ncbi:DUF4279 domain-containing protein [Niveibacterium sp. COAC-50]|uniref:DUF4279 domain-containing protein n=1 Tax=Niveibacterium sp. COAC-50 TaxID=2729384 RepID=UPI001555B86B|nr:DUF4279 domain-containing protein [Niveibacterium sp. COAC-50]
MQIFDADGNEVPQPPAPRMEELTHICEIGGQFDACSIYVEFQSPNLDRDLITKTVGLNPTKAWNAGEKRPHGNGRSGLMRVDDIGKWCLRVDSSNLPVNESIANIFATASQDVEAWRSISSAYVGRVALVGHASNWNREFNISVDNLSKFVERGLSLSIDAYFDGYEQTST